MTNFRAIVKRGEVEESIHEAKYLVKDSNYNALITSNNENDLVFPRSAIKIFQALPFIISEAHKKFNLDDQILAIACSSHCGENFHVKCLEKWIKKLNIKLSDLKCGIHNPINYKSSNKLLLGGRTPNQLHNNCSGKHLAMISGCISKKISIKNYLHFNHPYQKLIRSSLELFTNSLIKKTQMATDGCSAPQYAFKINNLADAMVNLIKYSKNNNQYKKPISILLNAIKKNPFLIGGTGRFDSELIKATEGRIFCKGGAEGVILFVDLKKQIGGIIKIKDGNERAIPPITMKILDKVKLLKSNEKKQLKNWISPILTNHANKQVGQIIS